MFHKICEIIFILTFPESIYRIFLFDSNKNHFQICPHLNQNLSMKTKKRRSDFTTRPSWLYSGTIIQSVYFSLKKKPLGCSIRKISFSYKNMRDYVSPNSQFPLFPKNRNRTRKICKPFSFRSGNCYN